MSASSMLAEHANRHGLELQRLETALEWQVSHWSGEMTDQDLREWAAWLASHSGNQHAWHEVERLAGRLELVPAELGRKSLKRPSSINRRQVLALLGLAGAGVMVARAGWVQRTIADCHCGPGEQRDLSLPGGGELRVNTASAVNLHQGMIEVFPGSEIALDTRSASQASLFVEMAGLRLQAGKSHSVLRDYGGQLRVSLLAGEVALLSGHAAAPMILHEGEEVLLSPGGLQRRPLDSAAVLAWTRGVLLADRMSMGDFLAELGRYRRGFLYCDDAVKHLIVSGAYPVNDTDFALQSLAQALPVVVHYRTPWLVHVSHAEKNLAAV